MSRHSETTYLNHMRDYAAEALQFSQGHTRPDLETDRMLMLATCRLLEMLGEAASQLASSFCEVTPQIPWRRIISLRHRHVHAYDQINFHIIWNIVTVDLPPLISALNDLMKPPPL